VVYGASCCSYLDAHWLKIVPPSQTQAFTRCELARPCLSVTVLATVSEIASRWGDAKLIIILLPGSVRSSRRINSAV
jgi:hypothetical protein